MVNAATLTFLFKIKEKLMKKAMLIINPTSGGEKALDYKEKLGE